MSLADSTGRSSSMADIILATFNSRFSNPSLGLRYIFANMGELRGRTAMLEFDLKSDMEAVSRRILKAAPSILGLGVYIWNVSQCEGLLKRLRREAPELKVVLGGPEISYETEKQELYRLADYVICGEGDLEFKALCDRILKGDIPESKIIEAQAPELSSLSLPYGLFSDEDLKHRSVYVEASRGCPFHCEFCLSSLDIPMRRFNTDLVIESLDDLVQRGARYFKFVDRTFNIGNEQSRAILDFFLANAEKRLFAHFEVVPDIISDALKAQLKLFPPGAIQLEAGVQSLNPEVCERIGRRQNCTKAIENLRFLKTETNVHVHADLVLGLPGESLESIAKGFDELQSLQLQEVQVGILKKLHGAPIARHDREFSMHYSDLPPYEIIENSTLDSSSVQRLKRFAHIWDSLANSGRFSQTLPLLWRNRESAFESFMEASEWIYQQTGRVHSIELYSYCELLFDFISSKRGVDKEETAEKLYLDYAGPGRQDFPRRLYSVLSREFIESAVKDPLQGSRSFDIPQRQKVHLRKEQREI